MGQGRTRKISGLSNGYNSRMFFFFFVSSHPFSKLCSVHGRYTPFDCLSQKKMDTGTISIELRGKMYSGPRKNQLNAGADLRHVENRIVDYFS